MTRRAAPLIINDRLPLWPVRIFVCAQAQTHGIQTVQYNLNDALWKVQFSSKITSADSFFCSLSLQVKPNCKTVLNGKIIPAAKYKANNLSKKTSAEEKEKGKEKEKDKDKDKEKEERDDNEETKEEETSEETRAEEQAFLVSLYKYMKERDTPIERIPFLGFKQSE